MGDSNCRGACHTAPGRGRSWPGRRSAKRAETRQQRRSRTPRCQQRWKAAPTRVGRHGKRRTTATPDAVLACAVEAVLCDAVGTRAASLLPSRSRARLVLRRRRVGARPTRSYRGRSERASGACTRSCTRYRTTAAESAQLIIVARACARHGRFTSPFSPTSDR